MNEHLCKTTLINPLLIRSLVGDHHHWTWRPPDFYWRPQAFYLRHKIFIGGNFHWKPQLFCRRPKTFRFKPQIFFEDRPQIYVREKMKIGGCLGSPMKIWGSRWKVSSLRGKSWGLRLKSWVVQWKFWGLQRKSEDLQRKSEDLQRKFGVSDENLGVYSPMNIKGSPMKIWLNSDEMITGSPIVLKWWWFLPIVSSHSYN